MNFRDYLDNANNFDNNIDSRPYNSAYKSATDVPKEDNTNRYNGNSQSSNSNSLFDNDRVKANIDKYSNMSQKELFEEFVKLSKVNREQGKLNDDAINNITDTLNPYLTPSQQQYLNDLFNMVK